MGLIYLSAERKFGKPLKNIAIYKFQRVESALERLNQALTRLDGATENTKAEPVAAGSQSEGQKTAKALAAELSQLRGQHDQLREAAGEALEALNAALEVLSPPAAEN